MHGFGSACDILLVPRPGTAWRHFQPLERQSTLKEPGDAEPHVVNLELTIHDIEELDVSGGDDFVFIDFLS